jgi:hypothetical protein
MLSSRSAVTLAARAAFAMALLVTQHANAAERHNTHMTKHPTTIFTGAHVRGAYAAVGLNAVTGAVEPNWSRYESGAISAPAGR